MTQVLLMAALPKSWPPIARRVLLDAARYYYRQMSEPFPVPDVAMERAIEWANRELDARDREVREEASGRWIDRWESGQLDTEMKRAIEATYDQLRRAERGIRSRTGTRKRSTRQLDAEIAETLAKKTTR